MARVRYRVTGGESILSKRKVQSKPYRLARFVPYKDGHGGKPD